MPTHTSRLVPRFWMNHQITQVTQTPYNPDLAPCDFWLFPKLKSPLKGKRFQTTNEIQENRTGQLMVIGKTVWGPKVPTLKGTEASLSYVQCSLYLVSSSVNGSIFHSTCPDTFWTDVIYLQSMYWVSDWWWKFSKKSKMFKIKHCKVNKNIMINIKVNKI